MTMHPAVLYHMIVSFSQPHADLLLSMDAERQVSAAGNSRSEARAEAIPSRLHTLVRPRFSGTVDPSSGCLRQQPVRSGTMAAAVSAYPGGAGGRSPRASPVRRLSPAGG